VLTFLVSMGIVLTLFQACAGPLVVSMIGTAIVWAGLATVAGRVEIGADGIVVRWLGTTRFISFRDVAEVRNDAPWICITDPIERDTWLRATHGESATLAGEIERARVAFRERARTTVDLPRELARGREELRTWIRRLRAPAAGYRDALAPHETLWRVIEDPTAEPEARVAAALVLESNFGDGGDAARERLRIAVDAVADPRVRIAMSHVTTDDDERVVSTLQSLVRRG